MTPAAGPAGLVMVLGERPRDEGAASGLGLPAVLSRAGLRGVWMATLDAALRGARDAVFDAVILDEARAGGASLWLPPLRRQLDCPVLVLAAADDPVDSIVALELGADACLPPTVLPRLLQAQLRALLRRSPPAEAAAGPLELLGWRLDAERQVLSGHGHTVPLSLREHRLLRCLMQAQGHPCSRAQLQAALPGQPELSPRSIDVYVSRLRRRLRDSGVRGLELEVRAGQGYALRLRPWQAVPALA